MAAKSKSDASPVWRILPANELAACADEWDELNSATVNLPVLDAAFYIDCLQYFGSGAEQLVLAYRDQDLIAAGILSRGGFGTWQTFQPSQAPLGAWLNAPDANRRLLWSGLQKAISSSCLVLGISQQDPLICDRPGESNHLQTLDYIETARIPVSGSFSDYWASRGRNLRQNLKRQRNRVAREDIATRLDVISDAANIGAAVDDFGLMESSGWKAQKGTAVHPDNAQGRFYRSLFERLAARNEATVYRYFYNDHLVATDLCVHRNRMMIILKTTYDESHNKTSPTHLMRQEVIERIFKQGELAGIEFYGKLMDWHTKWSDDIRRMYHVNHYRWQLIKWFREISRGGGN